jgi:hypothetical protein
MRAQQDAGLHGLAKAYDDHLAETRRDQHHQTRNNWNIRNVFTGVQWQSTRMTIAMGTLLIALALVLRWTSLDLAVPFAPGWHVTVWPVCGLIGIALVASSVRRWR